MAQGNQSKYEILPTCPEDAESMSKCNYKAFANSFFNQMTFPKAREHLTPKDEVLAYRTQRMAGRLRQDDAVSYKAVLKDQPDVVVGYANFLKPGHYNKQKAQASVETTLGGVVEAKPDKQTQTDEHPACMDVEMQSKLMAMMDRKREEVWGDETNFWYLAGLCVDPDYQRQGIASLLMEGGLRQADEDGLPIYLESTPEGVHVYPRLGFETCSELVLVDYGGHTVKLMIRQPLQRM
ncbi:hypothetical protein LTR36_010548 [Oleoguttula mirabilis]|uniref:N-acetyltransferase domain-containing protein n=1 Tax=Oleoguttula mirabilis TaxID=1507867 RepID=A0AAV9JQC4_9PEZI|nr:hypothetical protein LTR36_010548 [Oleoguttula mirabilis]